MKIKEKEERLLSDGQWFAIPASKLANGIREIRFDVFLRIGADHYAPVFSRATGIDYKRLAQYRARGVRELYLRAQDRQAWDEFSRMEPEAFLGDPAVPPEQKVALLKNLGDASLASVFCQFPLPEDGLEKSQKVVQGYVQLMSSSPQSMALLLKLAARADYSYYHAVATSVFSIYLAKALGRFNSEDVEQIGLGAFLHDIGKVQLSEAITGRAEHLLTETQRKLLMTHPKIGLDIVSSIPGASGRVRAIVYQHHEQPNGMGYPNGLQGEAIALEARIVRIADAFNSWISRRLGRDPLTPEEAFSRLATQKAVFDQELVRLFCRLFAQRTSAAA